MTIWTFVEYNTHPDHGQYTRWYYLGKHLAKLGHQVRVFEDGQALVCNVIEHRRRLKYHGRITDGLVELGGHQHDEHN